MPAVRSSLAVLLDLTGRSRLRSHPRAKMEKQLNLPFQYFKLTAALHFPQVQSFKIPATPFRCPRKSWGSESAVALSSLALKNREQGFWAPDISFWCSRRTSRTYLTQKWNFLPRFIPLFCTWLRFGSWLWPRRSLFVWFPPFST